MLRFLHRFIDQTLLRYLLVGLLTTVIGVSIMFSFYNLLHLNYWISSASNYIVGGTLSYLLNRRFTFHSKARPGRSVIRFVSNLSLCYLLAYGAAKPVICAIYSQAGKGVQDNIAMTAGVCCFAVLNYFGQRFFVFRT